MANSLASPSKAQPLQPSPQPFLPSLAGTQLLAPSQAPGLLPTLVSPLVGTGPGCTHKTPGLRACYRPLCGVLSPTETQNESESLPSPREKSDLNSNTLAKYVSECDPGTGS